jgi:hypothetical protein
MKLNNSPDAPTPLAPVEMDFLDSAPIRVQRTMVVRCSPADVFSLVARDPSSWGQWCPGFTTESDWLTAPPHGVGSRRAMRAFGRVFDETILAWEPDTQFAFRVDRGPGASTRAFIEDWKLAAVDGDARATRATWTMGVDSTSPSVFVRLQMAVQQAVMMRLAKGRMEKVIRARETGRA